MPTIIIIYSIPQQSNLLYIETDNCQKSQINQMEEELWDETASAINRNCHNDTEICQFDMLNYHEENSKRRWLYVLGYLVFYFVIMAIIYILIEYALIQKSQYRLRCNRNTLTCEGKIDFINSQSLIYFQLSSKCPPNALRSPVSITDITLANSTNIIALELIDDQQLNAYSYYRHLWGFTANNLIYSYNITVNFSHSIPQPFYNDLTVILRQAGMFDQDQTINQAVICLVFAGCIAFFNISGKIMENDKKIKPIRQTQKEIHKIYIETPEDIEELDENVQNLREMALSWLLKPHKKSFQFSESDSEYSFLSSE